MKTKLLIIALCTTFWSGAQAGFINLTPGGWHYVDHQNNPPQALFQLISEEGHNYISFFDDATPEGWTSQFGALNGGTSFFTDLVNSAPLSMSLVSWDFMGTPYTMRFVDVFGANNGDMWESIYFVTGATRLDSSGWLETLLDGNVIITDIAFYGTSPSNVVPDNGATVVLMGLGLIAIAFIRRRT